MNPQIIVAMFPLFLCQKNKILSIPAAQPQLADQRHFADAIYQAALTVRLCR
jgi:hypothetical protein